MKSGPDVVAAVRKLKGDPSRLFDLVRYQRAELHDAGLITDEEHDALVLSHGDGSVARLESYDEVVTYTQQLEEKLERAQEAVRFFWPFPVPEVHAHRQALLESIDGAPRRHRRKP